MPAPVLAVPSSSTTPILNALAILDTNVHDCTTDTPGTNTSLIDCRNYNGNYALAVTNTLNQPVTLLLQISIDGTNVFQVGPTIFIGAAGTPTANMVIDSLSLPQLRDSYLYIACQVKCSTAPVSGALTVALWNTSWTSSSGLATQATQALMKTDLDSIVTQTAGLATQVTLALMKTALDAVKSDLDTVVTNTTALGTQATLASLLAKFITDGNGYPYVSLGTLIAGENVPTNRMMIERVGTYTRVNANGTTTPKGSPGQIIGLVVWQPGTSWIWTMYDNTAASGTVIGVTAAMLPVGYYPLDIPLSTGLTIVSSGTAGDVGLIIR